MAATEQAKHTPGPWRAVALGGSSTVISEVKPGRNDTRIPPYAYDEQRGHCIAYPSLGDRPGDVRWDFVCFSHEDARLIAVAPELLKALKELCGNAEVARAHIHGAPELSSALFDTIGQARDALAKAEA